MYVLALALHFCPVRPFYVPITSLILSMCMFPFLLGAAVDGLGSGSRFPAVLIFPSDFTRSPAKVRMAAVTPGMLFENCNAMHTFNTS